MPAKIMRQATDAPVAGLIAGELEKGVPGSICWPWLFGVMIGAEGNATWLAMCLCLQYTELHLLSIFSFVQKGLSFSGLRSSVFWRLELLRLHGRLNSGRLNNRRTVL